MPLNDNVGLLYLQKTGILLLPKFKAQQQSSPNILNLRLHIKMQNYTQKDYGQNFSPTNFSHPSFSRLSPPLFRLPILNFKF